MFRDPGLAIIQSYSQYGTVRCDHFNHDIDECVLDLTLCEQICNNVTLLEVMSAVVSRGTNL